MVTSVGILSYTTGPFSTAASFAILSTNSFPSIWQYPVELAIIHEVENSTMYTTEVYTDGSKIGDNVGAAGIENGRLVHQLKFKLQGHCSNNQAEQIAILKVLEKLEKLQDGQDNDKRIAIYTDSKITWIYLQNKFKQNWLIEFIRNQIIAVAHLKWSMDFGWVKGHAGIEGNEFCNVVYIIFSSGINVMIYTIWNKVIIINNKQ